MPKLHSITALFDKPDEIIHAAKETVKKGYEKFDVHTPYPLHGMDPAMGMQPSKLGFFTLAYALTGTTIAISGISWITTSNYPMVIGGKPFWSIISYAPIMFELTVLLGCVLSVLTLLFGFLRLPNNDDPLQDTDYMERVSDDLYGLCIEAKDSKFNEQEVRDFMTSIGAKNITPIYYDDKELNYKHKILEPKFLGFLVLVAGGVSSFIYFAFNIMVFLPPWNWYTYQFKVQPQTSSTFFADGYSMRDPVEGTISRGNMPYLYAGQPEKAATYMNNSVVPTKEVLELGRKKYEINCSVCHGFYGAGDGRKKIAQYFKPPSLHSKKVKNWTDGRIYHVIMEGQNNVMPSYAPKLNEEERWAVIHYIRVLQRSFDPKETDAQTTANKKDLETDTSNKSAANSLNKESDT